MKIKIDIPDFLSIEDYQKLLNLDHLTELQKVVKTISIISKIPENDILNWDTSIIPTIYKDVIKCMETKEIFYPIFKYNDVLYGYENIDTMKLGGYTDLERLCEEPTENLHEIMAILYRPIEKHDFDNFIWKKSHNLLVKNNKTSNIFKHYKLEKYNSEDRFKHSNVFKELPIHFALGAMAFFLGNANGYLLTTQPYSTTLEKEMMMTMQKENLNLLVSIGAGLAQFIHSPNQVYSISQKMNVSLT